ncbi:MAG: molybdopterin molybdotransferase, partial [bacterium]
MISVEEASSLIAKHLYKTATESIPFDASLGRVLAENIHADRDFPPFNRVAMDGICIRYADYAAGQKLFPIQSTQAAGNVQQTLNSGEAIEIMTGASLSLNADTVIRYEDLEIIDGAARITISDVRDGQNVHLQGSDVAKSDVLMKTPLVISAAAIGVLATVGKVALEVYALPRVAIISTGEELVDVDQMPLSHQIRKSNVHTLCALLEKHNITSDLIHLKDDKQDIKSKLSGVLATYNVVLLSGAVSKGKFDFIPDMLNELGVKKYFHKVEQRPGKPFWFGVKGEVNVFAFPGNPVST